MVCKHCNLRIRYKNGRWLQIPDQKYRIMLTQWHSTNVDGVLSNCVRSVSDGGELGLHEPSKEGIIKRVLKRTK